MIRKCFFVFSFLLFNLSIANGNEKTVFIDIDYILNNSNLWKSILIELEKVNKENIKKLSKKEENLKKKKDTINKTKNISSKEKLENDINLFNQEVKEYKDEKNLLSKKLKEKKQNEFNKFLQQVNPIIQEYMKNNSIDIVLEKKQLFIGSSKNNISDDILKLINQKFEK